MKKYSIYFLTLVLAGIYACTPAEGSKEEEKAKATKEEVTFPELAGNMTIYEVNIRQFTPEGTFKAFNEHLPRLKELGTEILWLMPIQPIGEKNRKGSLGSYYSIKDYKAVNPEFGTLEDFKTTVDKAHELGMYVILDWVPNHTAWDHPWIKGHPEYYAKDSLGNITYEADWTDIALLDHSNAETRKEMIDAMKFWIDETDIDGFRCDHAGHEIPLYFWEEATATLDSIKDLFWLAEWDEPRMHMELDVTYNWSILHATESVAKGEHSADELYESIEKDLAHYGHSPFRLLMTTNHDENAWAGTVFERYGEGHKAFAVFTFTVYGIPMIYSGQEVGLDKRLAFFEKDSISWNDENGLTDFYKKLVKLRKDNAALWSGHYGGMPEKINSNNENILVYSRKKDNNQVLVILNLSNKPQKIELSPELSGEYENYMTNEQIDLTSLKSLKPYEYIVIVK
ncbi:alpha-glucosidase C-terminal domain-containing protein [Fulvivirga sp. 29W222]|uniref:Alpha-glucosidase C-terminal domain-containing protein n=1 Tax=Fulvivirga marina TaxID=2494733 RepID=A0A937KDC4_9BACT|nr:alpha-amylase family glycosyl hydrolase [Fulvivirga marina]MBL6448996.1 alpha-glucosidase C-terminal domain-containing protein [Fulvivirga marina]